MRNCKFCKQEIPPGRLKIVPDAIACVPCTEKNINEDIPVGIMIFDHKTAGTVHIVNKKTAELINRADRRGYKKHGNKIWE